MKVKKVSVDSKVVLDPNAAQWGNVEAITVAMDVTPIETIPSDYVKNTTDKEKMGKVRSIQVKTLHNGKDIFFRLEWEDASKDVEIKDTGEFPDAAGILLPMRGDADMATMGSRRLPVNAWYWRSDFEKPKNVTAAGLGTTEIYDKSVISSKSEWASGVWKVVMARALKVPGEAQDAVQLSPGQITKIAFAVWEGSNMERGGAKSYSISWQELAIEA